jgi:phosphoribosylformylglycinamidine synthase I
MSGRPKALIITAAGINCDGELATAFSIAGSDVESVHLSTLTRTPSIIDRFDLIGLPGGFSYGDAVAAGRIMAELMQRTLCGPLAAALQRGVPMMAPCNGFQIAVQMGLLPGPLGNSQSVALCQNESARFIDTWVGIKVPANTRCIWTQDLVMTPETALLPIAHGEGRFVTSPAEMEALSSQGQIAITYTPADNPNGSMGDVAGICDATGLVFGLMPHPERYTRWTHHPSWTRMDLSTMAHEPPGLQMFRAAVAHATGSERSAPVGTVGA